MSASSLMARDPGTDGVNSFKTCGISNALDGTEDDEDDEPFTEEVAQEIEDDEAEENEFGTDSEDDSDVDGE